MIYFYWKYNQKGSEGFNFSFVGFPHSSLLVGKHPAQQEGIREDPVLLDARI